MRYTSRAGLGTDVRNGAKKIPTEGFPAYELDQHTLRPRRSAQTLAWGRRACGSSPQDAALFRARGQRRPRGGSEADPAQRHRTRGSGPAHRSFLTTITIRTGRYQAIGFGFNRGRNRGFLTGGTGADRWPYREPNGTADWHSGAMGQRPTGRPLGRHAERLGGDSGYASPAETPLSAKSRPCPTTA